LRGIFLCTKAEIDWFINGLAQFFPEVHQRFAEFIPELERGTLLQAYVQRLFCDDPAIYKTAARNWSRYEGSCLFLEPQDQTIEEFESDTLSLGIGRLEAHYMLNSAFMDEDQLIKNIHKIRHLPAVIIQGRYDVICPPISAYRLHQVWPNAKLHMIANAGHAAMEPGIVTELVRATEQFKLYNKFL
jgi:proline iminopeptidase